MVFFQESTSLPKSNLNNSDHTQYNQYINTEQQKKRETQHDAAICGFSTKSNISYMVHARATNGAARLVQGLISTRGGSLRKSFLSRMVFSERHQHEICWLVPSKLDVSQAAT